MTNLRTLLVDDEAQARKRLARLLGAIEGVQVVGEAGDGEAMLRIVDAPPGGVPIDLLVLDINMPGLTGLDVAALLPKPAPAIIYVTAHEHHALAAFDRGAVDYVLKPVDPARLRVAVERVSAIRSPGRVPPSPAPLGGLERLSVETTQGIVLIDPNTITHLHLEEGLVRIHLIPNSEGEVQSLLCTRSLQRLEAELPGGTFLRVHRQSMVNLAHVQTLEPLPSGGYRALVTGGQRVLVSRQVARTLRRSLGAS